MLALRAVATILGWIVIGLLALAWAILDIAFNWIAVFLLALIALPWWAFLWLKWWRRECAGS